jgi:hypothetical protein
MMSHNAKVLMIGALLSIVGVCALRISPLSLRIVGTAFVGLWVAILLFNSWYGTARAGYPVKEEIGVALLDLGVIAVPALLVMWLVARV